MPAVTSPLAGTVAHLPVTVGQQVTAGTTLVFIEVMKMEHPVTALEDGVVGALLVAIGDQVEAGQPLLELGALPAGDGQPGPAPAEDEEAEPEGGAGALREDLRALLDRKALLADDARPEAVAKRQALGHRTARQNVDDLLDEGSLNEIGGLAIAAQRQRRSMDELRQRTPADGLITGTGTVNADRFGAEHTAIAVAAYDYTVLAGTQGWTNHLKKDRIFHRALRHRLPLVLFAEGGGGRPGDTDIPGGAWLDGPAFAWFATLSGHAPTIAIVNGRCFAGNAALAGTADIIIATEGSNLGMAGPAMIEGGGLGKVAPEDIGPMDVQVPNGVVDLLVADEADAVHHTKRLLSLVQGITPDPHVPDQVALRDAVPLNRSRIYDVRALAGTLVDAGTLQELRPDFGPGMLTAFARLDGRPVGLLANVPTHLGGAIDATAAQKATRHLQLCERYRLPVVVLCDTPGFMVGPEAETQAGVRHFGDFFLAGAKLTVPLIAVITRKAYGLGAMAMFGGHIKVPELTIGWPTAELGPMGLEGAVRLGFRRELEAVADPAEREAREQQLIGMAYEAASGLNVATHAEIDDVIDPADTRARIGQALAATRHRWWWQQG